MTWLAQLTRVCLAGLCLLSAPAYGGVDASMRNALRAALEEDDEQAIADAETALRAIAAGDEAPDERAEAWFRLGEIAESRGATADAAHAYRSSGDADPGSPFAIRAASRLRVVEQSLEGDADRRAAFALLRERYVTTGSEASIALAEQLLAETDDGTLQADLLAWLATEELYVRQDWERARQMFLDVTERASDDGALVAAFHGASLSSRSYRSLGDTRARVDAWVAANDRPAVIASLGPIRRDLVDRRGRYPAIALFGICGAALLGLFGVTRAWAAFGAVARRRWRPLRRALFVAWAFGAAGLLAEGYEHGYVEAFALCAPFAATVALVAGAIGDRLVQSSRSMAWTIVWRVATTGAMLGAVYAGMAAFGKQSVFGL